MKNLFVFLSDGTPYAQTTMEKITLFLGCSEKKVLSHLDKRNIKGVFISRKPFFSGKKNVPLFFGKPEDYILINEEEIL